MRIIRWNISRLISRAADIDNSICLKTKTLFFFYLFIYFSAVGEVQNRTNNTTARGRKYFETKKKK